MPDSRDADWTAGAPTFGWIAVAVIAAIAAGFHIFTPRPPLVSLRPSVETAWYPPGPGEQGFASRLWQDPLDAASEARKNQDARRDLFSTVLELVGLEPSGRRVRPLWPIQTQPDGKPALVLPVLVSSQPYGEIEESRLRARYAVLSALAAAHYVPADQEHMGVYRAPAGDRFTDDLLIPFEWYKAVPGAGMTDGDAPVFERVLVLWVDEDELGTKPLKSLVAITSKLRKNNEKGAVKVHCLGPTNSDLLLAIADELKKGPGAPEWMTIYSPWATISQAQITDRPECEPRFERLQRTVPKDDAMCKALVDELEMRGVGPKACDHIVLVTEWDTLYGQCLVPTFREAVSKKWKNGFAQANIVPIAYMRGLDGRLPGQQQSATDSVVPGPSEKNPPPNAESPPAGRSQVDYLERLEHHLRELDEEYRRTGEGRLRAIGVLGSDVYDKLLVLRALRPSFPGAIFFTTDLDARLLLASELPWTRNMIVASPFGLKLREDVQGAAPPFRDCYQSSAYVATLIALGSRKCPCESAANAAKASGSDRSACAFTPCIFEVGRHGAYDLSAGTQIGPHPPTVWTRNWWNARRLVLLGLLALVSAMLSVPLAAQPVTRRLRSRWFWRGVVALVIPVTVIAVLIALDQVSIQNEPFLVFQGISAWPTEVLRALALSLSIIFIIVIGVSLKESTGKLTERYFDSGSAAAQQGQAQGTDGKPGFFKRAFDILVPYAPSGTENVEALWKEFKRRRDPGHRAIRVVLGVALLFLAYLLLFKLLGPGGRPVRGVLNSRVDASTLFISIMGMLALLLLVLDVTAQCHWFARELLGNGPAGQWKDGKVAVAEAEQRGLSASDLNSWQSVKLLAEHTEVVGRFIYYPFIVILVFLISRHQVFEGWAWPPPLIIVFLSLFGTAGAAAVMLRASAKRAQARIVRDLRRSAALLDGLGDKRRQRKAFLALAAETEGEHRGAFSRVVESPVLRAILIPSVGIGALKLLEFLTGANVS